MFYLDTFTNKVQLDIFYYMQIKHGETLIQRKYDSTYPDILQADILLSR